MLEGRDWCRAQPASVEQLDALRKAAPEDLPESYFRLLAYSDGGEGPLPISPYVLSLDASDVVVDAIRTKNHGQSEFDGLLIFGGNGGGEYIAFDTRGTAPWPIVAVDMIAGLTSAEIVAPNFDEFLNLVGVSLD